MIINNPYSMLSGWTITCKSGSAIRKYGKRESHSPNFRIALQLQIPTVHIDVRKIRKVEETYIQPKQTEANALVQAVRNQSE